MRWLDRSRPKADNLAAYARQWEARQRRGERFAPDPIAHAQVDGLALEVYSVRDAADVLDTSRMTAARLLAAAPAVVGNVLLSPATPPLMSPRLHDELPPGHDRPGPDRLPAPTRRANNLHPRPALAPAA